MIVAAVVLVLSLRKTPAPDLRVSAPASGTPTVTRAGGPAGSSDQALSIDASWALSALPDCVRQHFMIRAPRAQALARVPASARPVGSRPLRLGACTVRSGPDGISIERGPDRLHMAAELLRAGDRYFAVSDDGTWAEVRSYTAVR